jgi:hypothetical protein
MPSIGSVTSLTPERVSWMFGAAIRRDSCPGHHLGDSVSIEQRGDQRLVVIYPRRLVNACPQTVEVPWTFRRTSDCTQIGTERFE